MLPVKQLRASYSAEQILVILLSRVYFGTENVAGVHTFLNGNVINWPVFYHSVAVNNIRGFIYDVISNHQIEIDTSTFNKLAADAAIITQKSFYQFKLTRQLLNEFKASGITVIPYKGSVLAGHYYKNPFTRESADIDFLVQKEDVGRIRNYLRQGGYQPKFDAADKYLPYLIENYKELSFTSPPHASGLSCSVEIQWQLLEYYFDDFPGYEFFSGHLRSQAEPEQIGLTETYDFICTASHHLIKEPLWKFKYLIDLACMVQTAGSRYDWNLITATFKKYGHIKFLSSGLTALSEVLGVDAETITYQPTRYRLFLTEKYPKSFSRSYLQLLKVINAHQTFSRSLKFNSRVLLSVFRPNLNDLELNPPVWAVPLLVFIKPFRIVYERLTANRKKD